MVHSYDEATKINFVWTMPQASQLALVECYQELRRFVKSLGRDIFVLSSDNESAMGFIFKTRLRDDNVNHYTTAPYTPAQDPAERAGGLLTIIARSLAIEANLPEGLWPELISTAAYILNRAPTKSLNFKTPYEVATGKKPSIAHMYKIGARAYAFKTKPTDLPRRSKLDSRCHIGYLVGFEGHNIYRIWIPSRREVIRTRDVIFNEQFKYQGDRDFDLATVLGPDIRFAADQELPQAPAAEQFEHLMPGFQDDQYAVQPEEVREHQDSQPKPDSQPQTEEVREYQDPEQQTQDDVEYEIPYDKEVNMADSEMNMQETMRPALDIESTTLENVDDVLPPRHPRPPSIDLEQELQHENKRLHVLATRTWTVEQCEKVGTGLSRSRHISSVSPEPKRWKELLKHAFADEFKQATEIEFNKCLTTGTFIWVDESEVDSKPIPLTWVWKYKVDDTGQIIKFKARICARGDLQYTELETYAATLSARTFRMMMAMIAQLDLETIQMDAVNAFLNADLPEPIYLYAPDGWKDRPEYQGKFLKCLKALYGFKVSPRLWYNMLRDTLLELRFNEVEKCIFEGEGVLVFFFVDDIVIAFPKERDKEASRLKTRLTERFEMNVLGELEWFCGIKITRNRATKCLWINQESYIEKMLHRYNLKPMVKGVTTPLPSDFSTGNEGNTTTDLVNAFGSRVGSINFAATQTRPDVAFATSLLARNLKNPTTEHIKAAEHVIQYLYQTRTLGIKYGIQDDKNPEDFYGASDASFADDPETRRSSEGFVYFLFGGAVDWKAVRQTMVTKSSTEAELYSLSHAASELIWWERLFKKLTLKLNTRPRLYCDNKQTLRVIREEAYKLHTRMRHVDVQQCWMREKYLKGELQVEWKPTSEIEADGFTKLLAPQRHKQFVEQVKLSQVNSQQ